MPAYSSSKFRKLYIFTKSFVKRNLRNLHIHFLQFSPQYFQFCQHFLLLFQHCLLHLIAIFFKYFLLFEKSNTNVIDGSQRSIKLKNRKLQTLRINQSFNLLFVIFQFLLLLLYFLFVGVQLFYVNCINTIAGYNFSKLCVTLL